MVYWREFKARIKTDFRFSRQELSGIIPAILITAFIFSFRDWGIDQFNLGIGFTNFIITIAAVTITLFFRVSCSKLYALSEGYKAEFKVWWTGLVIALIIAFITFGRLPLVLVGGIISAFMVRQRLGEFRYGFSQWNNAYISFWGILGNAIAAILFAIGLYAAPQNYFFTQCLLLNLIMGTCGLIPLPQLDGLNIFYGSRGTYYLGLLMMAVAWVLLFLFRNKVTLIIAVIIAVIITIGYVATGSEV